MEKIKGNGIRIIFDKEGNTLDIWFDAPQKEAMCEEAGDEVILKKDKHGNVIGIEKLNFVSTTSIKELEGIKDLPVSVSVR